MNPAIKRHFELQIKTFQNAPRDPYKLERLLQVKKGKSSRQKTLQTMLLIILTRR